MELRVVTANLASSMSRREARSALGVVLGEEPDVVGLQEWYAVRRGLLPRDGWTWRAPLVGGCVVGVRRGARTVLSGRTVLLSRPGRADRGEGWLGLEPARVATVLRLEGLAVVGYHLVHGVQARGEYRADRPRLVDRHVQEHARLQRLVDDLRRDGDVVAMGDSNLDGFSLRGLRSAGGGPTLGRRRVDDVLSTGTVRGVRLLETGSDHRAVVVDLTLGLP